MLKIGDMFTREHTHRREGYPVTDIHTVVVTELIENYKDAWTGLVHQRGVKFELWRPCDGYSTFHTLPYDSFRHSWVL